MFNMDYGLKLFIGSSLLFLTLNNINAWLNNVDNDVISNGDRDDDNIAITVLCDKYLITNDKFNYPICRIVYMYDSNCIYVILPKDFKLMKNVMIYQPLKQYLI